MHAHYLPHSPTMLWFLTKTRKEGSEKLKNLSCHSITWIQVILCRDHTPSLGFSLLAWEGLLQGLSLASQDNHPLLLPESVWGCTVPDVQSSLCICVFVSIDATDFKLEIRRGNWFFVFWMSETLLLSLIFKQQSVTTFYTVLIFIGILNNPDTVWNIQ